GHDGQCHQHLHQAEPHAQLGACLRHWWWQARLHGTLSTRTRPRLETTTREDPPRLLNVMLVLMTPPPSQLRPLPVGSHSSPVRDPKPAARLTPACSTSSSLPMTSPEWQSLEPAARRLTS